MQGLQNNRSVLGTVPLISETSLKETVRFFPHDLTDLNIALDYITLPSSPCQEPSQWPLRYIVLLWLFDDAEHGSGIVRRIESLAKNYLGKAGLEREGAAILLSRLLVRYDSVLRWFSTLNFSWTGRTLATILVLFWRSVSTNFEVPLTLFLYVACDLSKCTAELSS
jgi:hypothetical protein